MRQFIASMGQDYKIIFLESAQNTKILCWIDPDNSRLIGHAFLENPVVLKVEFYLVPGAVFHKTPLLWSGDHADGEEADPQGRDFFQILLEDYPDQKEDFKCSRFVSAENENKRLKRSTEMDEFSLKDYPFVVNHTLREYVNKYANGQKSSGSSAFGDEEKEEIIHPLPILCCEGNGRGKGDYYGTDMHLVGRWARHVISLEKEPPEGFTELKYKFIKDKPYNSYVPFKFGSSYYG